MQISTIKNVTVNFLAGAILIFITSATIFTTVTDLNAAQGVPDRITLAPIDTDYLAEFKAPEPYNGKDFNDTYSKKLPKTPPEPAQPTQKQSTATSTNNNAGGNASLRALVQQHFPSYAVDDAIVIALCESGGNANAHNYNPPIENSHGLFQINNLNMPERGSRQQLINSDFNVKQAAQIYKQLGRFGSTQGWYNCAKQNGIY